MEKKYFVRVDKEITEEIARDIRSGVDIGDETLTAPAKLDVGTGGREAEIIITEGRYHQIKRMFEAFGLSVIYLKRLSMGSLILDENLEEGRWRYLTEDEIEKL